MSTTIKNKTLGIVIVAYGNEATIKDLLNKLGKDKKSGDFIVLVDNHPDYKSAAVAEKHIAVNEVIRSDNKGLFAGGCNKGAAKLPKGIDLVLFLNPDTMPLGDALDKIRDGKQEWGAWMPLLVLPNGKVNSAGNVMHISGLSWVSHFGEDSSKFSEKTEVEFLSGACMVVRKKVFDEIAGFTELMYYEDLDLSLRMRLRGYKLGLIPSAHIEHDYIYQKGKYKFYNLERNRYLVIIRDWPAAVIVVLIPVLLAMEIGLWLVSILQLRFFLKVRSTLSALIAIPKAFNERRKIQKTSKINSREFFDNLEPNANTPLIGILGKIKLISLMFRAYYSFARLLIRQ